MVTDSGTYRQADDKDRSTSWATHDPTRRDLIFAPRTFFCFSATAQVAHLVLPDTRANASQNQKSHFFANAQREVIKINSKYSMKKSIKFYLMFLLLAVGQFAFGQNQEKIYYDKEWKGCSQSKASYYRLVTFNENGKPIGKVMDYFITGELQSEIEGAIYIDKYNDENSKWLGKSVGYYKSGKKQFEILHDNKGETVTHKIWFENGNQRLNAEYKNGKPNGIYATYYENGKLKNKFIYSEGKLADKWFTECDEFEHCQKIFFDGFTTSEDENNWEPADKAEYRSKIIANEGFLMENKKQQGGYAQWIHLPIDIANDFSIETIINFKSGDKNSGQGLIWGFKDWSNYYYFYISANGYFTVGAKSDGLSLEFIKWKQSSYINQNSNRNLIKVNKVKDKMYYSINSQIVGSEDFYTFRGNNIGFSIPSGEKKVLFERLLVRQDVDGNEALSKISSSSEWKGNGSGFFIDCRGYIATNYHVIKDAIEIEVDFLRNGQQQTFKAEVIQSDKQNDLAILKIKDNSFKPFVNIPYNFQIGLADVGTNVFALGYPMANIMGSEIKFTDGKISSKTGIQGDITMYQISVPVQAGNSGGVLFDYDGNLIGITSAGLNRDYFNSENVNYAIKSSYLKNLIDVLPVSIQTPNDKTIATKSLIEKIKVLSDYVVLIKIR